MPSDPKDVKPFPNGPPGSNCQNDTQDENRTDHIEVTCEFENEQMKFKVKPSTKLQKIQNTFCERKNLKSSSLRCFNEDGDRLELVSYVK